MLLLIKTITDDVPTVFVPRGRKVQLSTSKITQTNIPPRENVSYSKETQTPVEQMDGKHCWRHLEAAIC